MRRILRALAIVPAFTTAPAPASELELLHGWTAGSEAAMVAELRSRALEAGLPLKTSAVAGASHANTVLKTRFLSGQPPALAQTDKSVRVWGEAGHGVATELRFEQQPVAIPLNVHRLNVLWSNLRLLRAQGLAVPQDWDAFHPSAAALQRRGVLTLAIGTST